MHVLMFKAGDLSILFRTPFQRLPEPSELAKQLAALAGRDHAGLPEGASSSPGCS
jgi:hypothetical protein